MAIVILGLIFNFWAIRTLGRFFRTIIITHDDHQLVTTGLYKRFRHPSYFARLLILLGDGADTRQLVDASGNSGTAFVTFVYRIRVEEKILRAKFGKTYEDYASTRWAILPFIW